MKGHDGYSNRTEELYSATLPNPDKLRLEIFTMKDPLFISVDCSIPLMDIYSRQELVTPVRNLHCQDNPLCVWSMESLIDFITHNLKKDPMGNLLYFCPNCIQQTKPNSRRLDSFFYDRQMATLIALAQKEYQDRKVEPGGELKKFKSGVMIFKKGTGDKPEATYEVKYKAKKEEGKKPVETIYKFKLRLGEKFSGVEQLKFRINDQVNIQAMKDAYTKIVDEQSKILQQTKAILKACGSNTEKMEKEVRSEVIRQINKNTQVKVQKDRDSFLTNEFTFSFSNKSYMEPQNSSFSMLNVFYTRQRLWRSFYLQYEDKKSFTHPQGAVYIKDGLKIYIIGGYSLRFPVSIVESEARKRSKETNMTTDVSVIDLSQVEKIVMEPTLSINSSNIKGSGSLLKTKSFIDKLHKIPLVVKRLSNLPNYLCNSAGVVLNKSIFVFGGSTINTNSQSFSKEIAIAASYRYDISSNKWSALPPVPSPMAYHSAFVSKESIYLIANQEYCRNIFIYHPNSNKFQSVDYKPNPLLSVNNFKDGFRNRAVPLKVSSSNGEEFLFITGDKSECYAFSPSTLMFSNGGSQLERNVLMTKENSLGVQFQGTSPKIQQIFDYSPSIVNGIHYYVFYNLVEKKNQVVYGSRGDWLISDEYDHGSEAKK